MWHWITNFTYHIYLNLVTPYLFFLVSYYFYIFASAGFSDWLYTLLWQGNELPAPVIYVCLLLL
jgi:hypothetical protein